MGKKSASAPPPPDPNATIAAQTQANKDAARESAAMTQDIYGPGGSVTYVRGPDGVPIAQYTTLAAPQQELFDTQGRISNELGHQAEARVGALPTNPYTLAGTPYDPGSYDTNAMSVWEKGNLPFDPTGYTNIDQYVNDAGDAAFRHSMRYLQPQLEQQENRWVQRMADQGLDPAGAAYSTAMGNLLREQNQSVEAQANQARSVAADEAARRFGMEQQVNQSAYGQSQGEHQQQTADMLQRLQTEQGLRAQIIGDMDKERTQNFNEASMYLQGSPALPQPTTPGIPNYAIQAPDVGGITNAAYGNQMKAYQANQDLTGSKWKGASTMASAAAPYIFMSTRALKHDDGPPGRILDQVKKLPVRTWRYVPHVDPRQEMHIGPYAEDWKKLLGLGDGKTINMIDMMGVLLQSVKELAEQVDRLEKRR